MIKVLLKMALPLALLSLYSLDVVLLPKIKE